MGLVDKLFGNKSEKEIKRIEKYVDAIEALDEKMQALSDEELRAKTQEFKDRLAAGETLDDLLVEAFAVVREAADRTIHLKHYRVQLMGGIILHQGRIAEMKTGEGKTLVSTLPAYLNALEGKGVHIVTVNDYLAKRDANWMGQVHQFLGLSVGVILNSYDNAERQAAYNCDITYITNNELGFDYLRDNMVIYKKDLVQRELNYAIVDEVDSVLIDEARTPLIISGQSGKSTDLYKACDVLARQMQRGTSDGELSKIDAIMGIDIEEDGDFLVNEKDKQVMLTTEGVKKVEQFFHIKNLADDFRCRCARFLRRFWRARPRCFSRAGRLLCARGASAGRGRCSRFRRLCSRIFARRKSRRFRSRRARASRWRLPQPRSRAPREGFFQAGVSGPPLRRRAVRPS